MANISERALILEGLKELKEEQKLLNVEINDLKVAIAVLNTKAMMAGFIGGAFLSLIVTIVSKYVK